MPEAPIAAVCLAIISCCALVTTFALCLTARELRQTLWRVNALLPSAGRAVRVASRSVQRINRWVTRADQAAQHVEGVIHRACEAATQALDRWTALRGGDRGWRGSRVTNGARAEPRQHHRHR